MDILIAMVLDAFRLGGAVLVCLVGIMSLGAVAALRS